MRSFEEGNNKMLTVIDKIIGSVKGSGLIKPGMNIIIGLSGGPDSLCLLDVLVILKKKIDINIFAVHVNHHLRESADEEQRHVEKICAEYGVESIVINADCRKIAKEMKMSVEEAGRVIRYGAFTKAAQNISQNSICQDDTGSNTVIAVAHNADDQSETVLFRIIRGTGIHGLAGIMSYRDDYRYPVIRPLLNVTRADIEEYIKERGLNPNIDDSNYISDVSRNKLRLELIPQIEKEYNPQFSRNLRRLADNATVDDDYMSGVAYSLFENNSDFDEDGGRVIVDLEAFSNTHPAIMRRIAYIILQLFELEDRASRSLIMYISTVMQSGNPSARISLPYGIRAYRKYNKMIFEYVDDAACDSGGAGEAEKSLLNEANLIISVISRKNYTYEENAKSAAFDYNKFLKDHPEGAGMIELRTRRQGDYIIIRDGKRKKIQDLFVDDKISRKDRNLIKMATIGSEVLWIPADKEAATERGEMKGRFSQKYQITEETKEVLFLEIV